MTNISLQNEGKTRQMKTFNEKLKDWLMRTVRQFYPFIGVSNYSFLLCVSSNPRTYCITALKSYTQRSITVMGHEFPSSMLWRTAWQVISKYH